MQFQRCPNPVCGRPYQLNEFGPDFSRFAELGRLTCPHCGFLVASHARAAFLTHALSGDEEATFNASNPVLVAGDRS